MRMTLEERRKRRVRVIARLKAGDDPEVVAKESGLSVATLDGYRRSLISVGVQPRKSATGPIPISGFKVLRMLLDGRSEADVAQVFNVSFQYVNQIKKSAVEAGFKMPKRKRTAGG